MRKKIKNLQACGNGWYIEIILKIYRITASRKYEVLVGACAQKVTSNSCLTAMSLPLGVRTIVHVYKSGLTQCLRQNMEMSCFLARY